MNPRKNEKAAKQVRKEFEREYAIWAPESKFREYVNGVGLSWVEIFDKQAGANKKDFCIYISLEKPLPKHLHLPKTYKGLRVYTKVVGKIVAAGRT